MEAETMTFPSLKIKELVLCSAELGVPLSEDDLNNPKPEVIKGLLTMYVEVLLNLQSVDHKQQPTFGAMMIDNPELHENSLPFLINHRAMIMMMEASHIHDFSLQDIIKPETKRMKRIFSALVNFAKFREMLMTGVQDLEQEQQELNTVRAARQAELDALKKHLEIENAKREAEAPKVAELEQEVASLTDKVTTLNKTQANLQAKNQMIKDDLTEVNHEVSKMSCKVDSARQQCSQYESQIVRSPQRIKKEILHKASLVKNEEQELVAAEDRARTLDDCVAKVTESQGDLRRCRVTLNEVGDEYKRLERTRDNVAASQDSATAERKQLKEVAAAAELLQRQIDSAQHRLSQLDATYETKREAGLQSIEETRQQREQLAEETSAAAVVAKENTEVMSEIRGRLVEIKAVHAADVEGLRQDYNKLLSQIQTYHTELETVMHIPVHVN